MSDEPPTAAELAALQELEHAERIDGHEGAFDLLDKRAQRWDIRNSIFLLIMVAYIGFYGALIFLNSDSYLDSYLPRLPGHFSLSWLIWFLGFMFLGRLFGWIWPPEQKDVERRIHLQVQRWQWNRIKLGAKANQ